MQPTNAQPENFFSGIGKEAMEGLTNVPTTQSLYHYTDAAGLEGMLRSNSLWLTDARFLNDMSEGVYGLNLAVGVIRQFLSDKPEAAQALGERVILALNQTASVQWTAACCFCRDPDLLTQWRAYGGSGTSYCIEFDPQGFAKSANFQPALVEVIYEPKRQKEILLKVIQAVYEQALAIEGDNPNPSDGDTERYVAQAAGEIGFPLYWMKHPAFESEREERLAIEIGYLMNSGFKHQVRKSALGFTPYFEWKPVSERLPITSVMLGPTLHREYAQIGLSALLETTQYRDVTTRRPSAIPLR